MAFEFAYMLGGGVPAVKEIPVKASEAIVRGFPVNLESGLANVAAAADTAFAGIANESVTGTSAQEPVEVILCTANTVFRVNYTTGSKTSLNNADIGTAFDLKSGDLDNIDLDDTTGGAWIVIDYDNDLDVAYVVCDRDKAAVIAGGSPDATE